MGLAVGLQLSKAGGPLLQPDAKSVILPLQIVDLGLGFVEHAGNRSHPGGDTGKHLLLLRSRGVSVGGEPNCVGGEPNRRHERDVILRASHLCGGRVRRVKVCHLHVELLG